MKRYWIIAPYNGEDEETFEKAWQYDLANGTIAVGGYKFGKSIYEMDNFKDVKARFVGIYSNKRTAALKARWLWRFTHEISISDMVIARKGIRKIIGVGNVISKPYWDKDEGMLRTDSALQRMPDGFCTPNFIKVKWERRDIDLDRNLGRLTVIEIPESRFRQFIQ